MGHANGGRKEKWIQIFPNRQKEVFQIYNKVNRANKHKMIQLPVVKSQIRLK